jgi:hypothetical protein
MLFLLLQNWRTVGQNKSYLWGSIPVGRGRKKGNGVEGRIWFKYHIDMYVNRKMIPVVTIGGMGAGGLKEIGGGGEFKYDIFDIL